MSFDLPASIQQDLETYAKAEHMSPSEAAVKFIQSGLKGKRRKADAVVVSEADVEAYYEAFPGFREFADVTDEQWEQVLKSTRRMSKQGLSAHG
jgi:hypothetical protein